MPRRELSNRAKWALEDAYAALAEIDRQLAPLTSLTDQVSQSGRIARVATARLAANRAMLVITEAHPNARLRAAKLTV